MILILVGIPGTGKSTVLKTLQEVHPSIEVINYGEVMLQEAAMQGLERDELRRLPIEEQQEIGLAAAQKISQKSDSLTILDTHACIKTPAGFVPGIPLRVLNALKPKGLIFVHASPAVIAERRRADNTRKRDQEDLTALTLHQELSKSILVTASLLTGATLCLVNNDSDRISDNIQPLLNLIAAFQGQIKIRP